MHSKRHVLYYVSGIVFQLPVAALKAAAQGEGPTGVTSDNYHLTCIILDFDRQKNVNIWRLCYRTKYLNQYPRSLFLSAVTRISEKVQCALRFFPLVTLYFNSLFSFLRPYKYLKLSYSSACLFVSYLHPS